MPGRPASTGAAITESLGMPESSVRIASSAILTITADAARLAFLKVEGFRIACAVRLRGLSRSLAAELLPYEIHVVCLRLMGSQTLPPRGGVETSRRPIDLVA